MSKKLSKAVNIRLKILCWYQIFGGVTGLLLAIWLLAHTNIINGLALILYITAFALYSFSLYTGKLLLGDHYEKGLKLSIVNQSLQIGGFLILGFGYLYIAGIMLVGNIGYYVGDSGNGFNIGFNFGFTSKWRFDIASSDHSFSLSINFVAIYLTWFSYKLLYRTKNENVAEIETGVMA